MTWAQEFEFCNIKALVNDQEDIAIIVEELQSTPGQFFISAYCSFDPHTLLKSDIIASYLTTCDPAATELDLSQILLLCTSDTFPLKWTISSTSSTSSNPHFLYSIFSSGSVSHSDTLSDTVAIYSACKYKPVAQKICPVLAELPDKFHIQCRIIGDPLTSMPPLSPNPLPFQPTGWYTAEQWDIINKVHPEGYLWPQECALMHHFMCIQNKGFAWDDSECGCFHEDFFPPVIMPVIEHKPWVLQNMFIPPGIYDKVCIIIQTKIDAGVYKQSKSSCKSH